MKVDRRILIVLGVFYAVSLIGILIFYITNPFDNKCVEGDCFNGKGTFIHNSGMKYEGEWKNGIRHGNGTLVYPNIYTYTGEWKNNMMDGLGTLEYYWYKYVGEWRRGKKNGKGDYWFFNMKYEGHWKDDLMHGNGTMFYPGGFKWVGQWKDNVISSGEGSIVVKSTKVRYEGQMENGKMYGSIKIAYPDRRRFVGELIKGSKKIQGTEIYPDGSKHNIILKNDLFLLN